MFTEKAFCHIREPDDQPTIDIAGRPLPIFFLFFPIFPKSSYLFLFLLQNSYFFLFFQSFGIKHIDICRSALT